MKMIGETSRKHPGTWKRHLFEILLMPGKHEWRAYEEQHRELNKHEVLLKNWAVIAYMITCPGFGWSSTHWAPFFVGEVYPLIST